MLLSQGLAPEAGIWIAFSYLLWSWDLRHVRTTLQATNTAQPEQQEVPQQPQQETPDILFIENEQPIEAEIDSGNLCFYTRK